MYCMYMEGCMCGQKVWLGIAINWIYWVNMAKIIFLEHWPHSEPLSRVSKITRVCWRSFKYSIETDLSTLLAIKKKLNIFNQIFSPKTFKIILQVILSVLWYETAFYQGFSWYCECTGIFYPVLVSCPSDWKSCYDKPSW